MVDSGLRCAVDKQERVLLRKQAECQEKWEDRKRRLSKQRADTKSSFTDLESEVKAAQMDFEIAAAELELYRTNKLLAAHPRNRSLLQTKDQIVEKLTRLESGNSATPAADGPTLRIDGANGHVARQLK